MKKYSKNVLWLGFVSLLNDISSKIILPILPLFISSIGGGGFAIGLISGLGESIASLFKMLAGYWSDKIGKRKPFVFAGYFVSAISKLLLTFSSSWPQVLALRTLERFGKGVRSAPRDAILAASTERKKRGIGFGIHRAMDSGGAVIGSLLAFVMFWYFGLNFNSIFLVAGIFAFLSLIPLTLVKEKREKKFKGSLKIELKSLSKSLKIFIFISSIFAIGNFSYMFFVLKSQPYFMGKFSVAIPILLYTLYSLSYSLFAIPSGFLSDKFGRKKILLIGYLLFGLVSIGFVFSASLYMFILFFILFGIDYALVNSNERAFVSDLAKEKYRGGALGTFHMVKSLVALPAGIIAGLLWDINSSLPFIFGMFISLISVTLFFVLWKAIDS